MTSEDAEVRWHAAVARPLQAFLRLEAASGILLLASAAAALAWANVHPRSYSAVFDDALGGGASALTLRVLINDGLMSLFFFVVGLEIKRELAVGELDSLAKASLPAIAAAGGMLVPAAIFLAFNWGGPGQRGWGIPMATDIAFCVGILTLLGKRVPRALVVFVTALAIFDDIGGILVIAFFYGHGLDAPWLLGAGVVALSAFALNRAYVTRWLAYAIAGAALWYTLHHSGIHATLSGVVLGFMVPARPHAARKALTAPAQRFLHRLHPFVAFLIMPVFALANSGVPLAGAGVSAMVAPVALGTTAGLFVGKQLGIFALTALAVRARLAPMPGGASLVQLWGVSVLAGIGFTVAIFIATLAYAGAPELLAQAKVGILLGSFASGLAGFLLLRMTRKEPLAQVTTRP